jgi:hypothetical protein
MDKLAEIRNQELICRKRALSDTDQRAFWLAKAEEWAQRALDEIAFHFREAGGDSFTDAKSQIRPGERHHAAQRGRRVGGLQGAGIRRA